ncbi:MAG: hypothetical protein GEU28_05305 [Dehalococcoidia bacterium]|nr:hypothetical protein [Dehalococcoidia bacterium]
MRLIAAGPDFGHMLHLAFDQIVHYGKGDRRVMARILESLLHLSQLTDEPSRLRALSTMTERVARAAETGLDDPDDRRQIEELTERLGLALAGRLRA